MDIAEHLAKLEGTVEGLKGAIDGLKHAQNITIGALGVGFAITFSFMVYLATRIDNVATRLETCIENTATRLDGRIDNLPAEFERLNQTLSNAITAAKQQVLQIILVPTPQPK